MPPSDQGLNVLLDASHTAGKSQSCSFQCTARLHMPHVFRQVRSLEALINLSAPKWQNSTPQKRVVMAMHLSLSRIWWWHHLSSSQLLFCLRFGVIGFVPPLMIHVPSHKLGLCLDHIKSWYLDRGHKEEW
jgi:hypothetical protein